MLSAIGALLGISLAALPHPPDRVVRETRCYGRVVVDHHAHLARRTSCRACHGDGQVGKLELTPAVAHERCRGCHVTARRGPTACAGCHDLAKPGEAAKPVAPAGPRDDGDDRTPLDRLNVRLYGPDDRIPGEIYDDSPTRR